MGRRFGVFINISSLPIFTAGHLKIQPSHHLMRGRGIGVYGFTVFE